MKINLEQFAGLLAMSSGIALYLAGMWVGLDNSLWWTIGTGTQIVTGLVLFDGGTRGWLL